MANHYIQQGLERRLILLGLTDAEIAIYINVAIAEKLDREKKKVPIEWGTRDPALQIRRQ